MVEQVWRRAEHFVSTPVETGIVILDLNEGIYYAFSETAAAIWNLLDQDRAKVDIERNLMTMFDVPADVCAAKVAGFVDDLAAKGLVQPVR